MTSLPTESNVYSWDQWELWRQYNQQYYPPYWQFYQPYIPNPVTSQTWRYPEQEAETQPLDLRVDELFMNENNNRNGVDAEREEYASKIPCSSPRRIQENPSSEDDATFEEEVHSEVRYTEKHPLLKTMLKNSDDESDEIYRAPTELQQQENDEPVNSPYSSSEWNENEKSPSPSPGPENMTNPPQIKVESKDTSPKPHSPPLALPPFSTISSFSEENHRLSEPKSKATSNLLPPNGIESVSSSSSVYSSSYTNSPYTSEQLISSPDRTVKEEKPEIPVLVNNSISEESWRNSYTTTPDRLPYVSNDVVSSSFHSTPPSPNLNYYAAASQHNVNFLSYRNGPSQVEMSHSSMPTSSLRVDANQEYKYSSLAAADSPLYKNDEAKATNRRQRVLYSDFQNAELEKQFQINRYIRGKDRQQLAMLLNLTEEQIKLWFQNKRNRAKKYYQRRLETTPSHLRSQETSPRHYLSGQPSGLSSSVSPTPNSEIHQMMSCPPQYQHMSSHFNFYNSSPPKNVDM